MVKIKSKSIKVSVVWETDGKDIDLPKEIEIPNYVKKENYDIADYLSNRYGWLVKNYTELKTK